MKRVILAVLPKGKIRILVCEVFIHFYLILQSRYIVYQYIVLYESTSNTHIIDMLTMYL